MTEKIKDHDLAAGVRDGNAGVYSSHRLKKRCKKLKQNVIYVKIVKHFLHRFAELSQRAVPSWREIAPLVRRPVCNNSPESTRYWRNTIRS